MNKLAYKIIAPAVGIVLATVGGVIWYSRLEAASIAVLLAIGLIGAGVLAVAELLILRKSTKPLKNLIACAQEADNGNLDVGFWTDATDATDATDEIDEIGELAGIFGNIVGKIKSMQREINAMVAKTNSGETYHRIEIENAEFPGAFAEILERVNAIIHDFEFTLDLIDAPYLCIDPSMSVRHANIAARKLTGTDRQNWQDEVVGMHIDRFLGAEIVNNPATVRAFSDNTVQSSQIQVQSGGKLIDFDYMCAPYEFTDGSSGGVIVLTDITSLKTMQRAIEKTNAERLEKVQESAEAGTRFARELGESMEEIKKSSENITSVIKTIESLARQTTLLSLNASVETARAGEAGRAFAVVASEVRDLAERSTVAAKNTSEMLVDLGVSVEIGSKKSGQTTDILLRLSEGA